MATLRCVREGEADTPHVPSRGLTGRQMCLHSNSGTRAKVAAPRQSLLYRPRNPPQSRADAGLVCVREQEEFWVVKFPKFSAHFCRRGSFCRSDRLFVTGAACVCTHQSV